MIFFTSDLHLGHENVIKYAKRPFANAKEMDEALVSNWNARIRPNDTVYVVGDVSFHRPEETRKILRRMNGTKALVLGNHDKKLGCLDMFVFAKDMYTLKVEDAQAERGLQNIVLCHYAMRVWDKSHYGAWHLYGHSHNSLPDDPTALSIDVGVDAQNFAPISYEEVREIMRKKTWKPVDHHVPR